MKKLCLLSGMMVFGFVVNADVINQGNLKKPGNITEEERRNIENVQWGKISRQGELARPSIYKMVDALIKSELDANGQIKVVVDWPAVFRIIDSMHGAIDVNEYRSPWGPLLWVAVEQKNFLAAKTLLEKYHANPNFGFCTGEHEKGEKCNMNKSLLALAHEKKDLAMAMLLRQHGANM